MSVYADLIEEEKATADKFATEHKISKEIAAVIIRSSDEEDKNLKAELSTLETQRKKLYDLTKLEGTDVAEVNRELIANTEAQATVTQRMAEATANHKQAVEAGKENSAVRRLLEDEQDVLYQLSQQLAALGTADKKMVVEAMLGGDKMEVHSWDAAEGGKAWQVQHGILNLSMDVIKQLMEAGKLDALKNQYSNSAGHRRVRPL